MLTQLGEKMTDEEVDELLKGVEALQALLTGPGPFFDGDKFGYADLLVAPFLVRAKFISVLDVVWDASAGERVLGTLSQEKYAKFRRFQEAVETRPSVLKTFPVNKYVDRSKARIAALREKAAQ